MIPIHACFTSVDNEHNSLSDSSDENNQPVRPDNFDIQQDAPFNIADVPELHVADDPVQQSEVLTAIQRDTRPQRRHTEQFYLMPRTPIYLSTHRANYVNNNSRSAINLLKHRSTLVIDQDYKIDASQDNVLIRFDEDFLDHILYLGNRIGIDATLPNSAVLADHAWHIDLTFSKMFKLWPDSKISLPFSTTGRMIYIGTRSQEEIWLSFVPRSLVNTPNLQPDMTVLRAPSTSLTAPHAYIAVMFFAHCLSAMNFHDIYCADHYPDPPTRESVRQVTDIL